MNKILLTTIAAGVLSLGAASQSALANDVSSVVSSAGAIVSIDKNYNSPILSLKGYNKVFIQELALDHTRIISPPWIDKESFQWQPTASNLAYLKSRFQQGVAKGLTENNGRYEIVEQQGKGVLVV